MLKPLKRWRFAEAHGALELEVRRDLVNTLYASTRTLLAGALAGAIVTFNIAAKSGSAALMVAAGLVSLIGLGRLALNFAYKAARRRGRGESPLWEGAYQCGAAAYSGLLGVFTLLTLFMTRDTTLHLLATSTAIGYAAGIAGRNAGRPAIAVTQLTLATLPVAIGLMLTGNDLYRMLGIVTLIFFLGMIDITLQTYDVVLRAFRNARENQGLVKAVQIKAAEAFAANEAKTRFLANMSHEIRTPLNGVLGMTEAMMSDPLSEQQRARLKVIRQSGSALLTLLNDILDLSKVEAGKLEIQTSQFHLGDLLESVETTYKAIADKRGIGFHIAAPSQDLGMYEGDEGRLRQILFNLISNALKFTEAGRVNVTAAFDGEALNVEVTDTGIGIAPEHLDGLFQRFSQADASTTRRFGGTGLGLAICQELATLLGGRIWAQSRPGEGATFFVRLPLVRLADGPATAEAADGARSEESQASAEPAGGGTASEATANAGPPGRKPRLLCAEDNEVNQMVLKALLEPLDYDLIIVDDGLQAVEAYRRETFDLVLLDVQMPVMDGPTAAKNIRLFEVESNAANVPIIAVTANVMPDQVKGYLAAGMNHVIPKPLNIDELYKALQFYLFNDVATPGANSDEATAVVAVTR